MIVCKRCGAEDSIYLQVFCTYEVKDLYDYPSSEGDLAMTHVGRACCGMCGRSSKRIDLIAKEN